MKRGFTLLELIVSIAIMAMLATLPVSSYFAIQRGIEARSAMELAESIIRQAAERANIDRKPTAVWFYNELLQEEDLAKGRKRIVRGVAIAVRPYGRITDQVGDLLYDEFGELEASYATVDDENALDGGGTVHLYRFSKDAEETSNNELKYSTVYATVYRNLRYGENEMWVSAPPDLNADTAGSGGRGGTDDEVVPVIPCCAFKKASGGRDSVGDWRGKAYAFQFANVQLPDGYTFGANSASLTLDNPVQGVRVDFYAPSSGNPSLKQVDVYGLRMRGGKSVPVLIKSTSATLK